MKFKNILTITTVVVVVGLISFSTFTYASAIEDKPVKAEKEKLVEPDKMPEVNLALLQKNIVYPEKARKNGIEGKVMVEVIVKKDGSVGKCKVVSTDNKILDKAAIDAIKKAKFNPAEKDGKPVKAKVVLPIMFKLN